MTDSPASVRGSMRRPLAYLLHAGRRIALTGDEITVGRSEENELVVAGERVSRRHARVYARDGEFFVADLGSRHGTLVNGSPIGEGVRRLESGDAIGVGEQVVRFLAGEETRMASRVQAVTRTERIEFDGGRLTIGRDGRNDLVLTDPNVSRFHAELVAVGEGAEIVDLGSRNGTRVNGSVVDRVAVPPGALIGIGPFQLVFDGRSLAARDDRGAMRLDARDVTLEVRGSRILAPTSLSIEPGELVAFIGESGAGKSTLLKVLAGVQRATAGSVTVNGEPLESRITDIGYVPQDEIVHPLLAVREALGYAARLRLPEDATDDELSAAVDRALAELSMTEQADARIGSLSGGQRKRAGVATELIGRPSLLFLDEPTTGLDPGLETKMMALLRALSDRGRAVVVVTHATKNLALCDRVVVMARGGVLAFDGSPDEAVAFFGVADYDEIYTALADRSPDEWAARFAGGDGAGPNGVPIAASGGVPVATSSGAEIAAPDSAPGAAPIAVAARPPRPLLPQLRLLTARYARLFARDRRNALLLLGQAPLLALFDVALFHSGLFDPGGEHAREAATLLFLLAITVVWIGAIDAAPEIVKERAVVEREAAIGVRLPAYLGSKATLLFGLLAVQVLLYSAVIFAFQPLHADAGTYLEVLTLLVLTGFAAVAMGLLVSALVNTQQQAISLIPLAVIPQLLFAGMIVPLAQMPEPAHSLAYGISSQWSLASLGDAVDMNGLIAADPLYARVNPFGTDFFDVSFLLGAAVQAAFSLGFLALVAVLLGRRLSR